MLLHFLGAGRTIIGMGWVIAIVIIFAAATGATHDVHIAEVITVAASFLIWLVSVWLTPFRKCRTCGGTGRLAGSLSTWANRPCPSCGGMGRHRRYFVTTVFGEKQTLGERRATRARARRNRPRI